MKVITLDNKAHDLCAMIEGFFSDMVLYPITAPNKFSFRVGADVYHVAVEDRSLELYHASDSPIIVVNKSRTSEFIRLAYKEIKNNRAKRALRFN